MKKIGIIAILIISLLTLISCGGGNGNTSTTKTSTTKTTYIPPNEVSIEVGQHKEEIAFYNQTYQPTNLYVNLIFDDGSKQEITYLAQYMVDTSVYGYGTGYVSYKQFTSKFTVNVIIPTISGVRLQKTENYKEFEIGDTYDSLNIDVIAIYNDGNEGRTLTYDYYILNTSGFEIDKTKPFESEGIYIAVFQIKSGDDIFKGEYFIEVFDSVTQREFFEIKDNSIDITDNYSFNEMLFTEIFNGDYINIEVIGELNRIEVQNGDDLVSESYLGKDYHIRLNLNQSLLDTTKDSVRFTVKAPIRLEMVVNASGEKMPHLSIDYLRTSDFTFDGSIGEELSLISLEIEPGTYYLGHSLEWLNIYEFRMTAV